MFLWAEEGAPAFYTSLGVENGVAGDGDPNFENPPQSKSTLDAMVQRQLPGGEDKLRGEAGGVLVTSPQGLHFNQPSEGPTGFYMSERVQIRVPRIVDFGLPVWFAIEPTLKRVMSKRKQLAVSHLATWHLLTQDIF